MDDYGRKYHVEHKDDTIYGKNHTKCPMAFGHVVERGGVRGGNCWNDDSEEYSERYVLPDMTAILVEIITHFYEDMTLKEFYKHFHGLAIHGETSAREYYGNRTDYATIYMLVDRVYAGLIELDIERERKAQGL